MPDFGKISTWLFENGGMMMTWTIVGAIVLLTLWVKKDEWFGSSSKPKVTPTPTKVEEAEPKKEPEKEPEKTPIPPAKVDDSEAERRRQKSIDNFRAGLWKVFGAGIAMIIIVLLAQNLNKAKNDYIYDGPVARPPASSGASAYFAWKYTYENEIKQFWYLDSELNLTPREAWNMVDTVKYESPGFRMYNDDGSVVRGKQNPRDVGALMINLDASREEIPAVGCDEQSIESFACQVKVARLKYKKNGHKPWKAYEVVMKKSITTTLIVAPVGEWSDIYYVQQGSSCLWTVDKEVDMMLASGEVKKLIPEKATFFDSPTTMYSVPEGPAGNVTIECRQ